MEHYPIQKREKLDVSIRARKTPKLDTLSHDELLDDRGIPCRNHEHAVDIACD